MWKKTPWWTFWHARLYFWLQALFKAPLKMIRVKIFKFFFGIRDAHVKRFIRVVFFTFFSSKWWFFVCNSRKETWNTAFESWDIGLLENKIFDTRRIFYAPRVGPKFHLWAQKSAFSWGWKRQKLLMTQKIDFFEDRDINTAIQPRKKKHQNKVSSALKTF